MMSEQPLVSVLMTSYNRESYISEAIESVLASTYQNFELIIVDDVSKDKTFKIAQNYAEKDDRIKLYRNDTNLGDYPNRNKAASYATGKYIKYLDSDDIIYPYGIRAMVDAMEASPEAGMGFANYWHTYRNRLPFMIRTEDAYYQHYFNKGFLYVGPSGSIYNRDFFNKIGGFNIRFGVASDFEFNLKAAQNAPVVCFQHDLFWWRPHEGQEINKRKNEYEILNNEINEFYLTHSACPLNNEERKIARNNLKNILARGIWLQILRGNILTALSKRSTLNISFMQMILSVLPSSIRRKIQSLT